MEVVQWVMGCSVCCGVWTQQEKFPGSAAVCVESPQPEGAPALPWEQAAAWEL